MKRTGVMIGLGERIPMPEVDEHHPVVTRSVTSSRWWADCTCMWSGGLHDTEQDADADVAEHISECRHLRSVEDA